MSRILFAAVVISSFVLGCNSEKSGDAAPGSSAAAAKPAAAAGDVSCDAVVAKLASFETGAGEPEKKLWTKMCAEMPAPMKSCLVAAKTKEDRDACGKDQKLIK